EVRGARLVVEQVEDGERERKENMAPIIILFSVLAAAAIQVAATGFRVVRPFEKGLVEFLGRYEKTVDSGLRWVMPFVKRLIKVDMREQVVDVQPQEVITKDNVAVTVDAVNDYEATDNRKSTRLNSSHVKISYA